MFNFSSLRGAGKALLAATALTLGLTGAAAAAAKEKGAGITVLGVWAGKRSDARLAGDLTRRLHELGEDAQLVRTPEKSDWSCAESDCLRALSDRLHAGRLLQAAIEEVDRESQNYLITVRMFDPTTGRVEQRQASCDGCGTDQRIGQVAATAARMAEAMDSNSSPQAATAPPAVDASATPPPEPAQRAQVPASSYQLTSVKDAASLQPSETGESTPARPWRKNLSLLLAGVAITSGAIAIGLTVAVGLNKPLCSIDENKPDPVTGYYPNDQTCKGSTLGITWGTAAAASIGSLVLNFSKERR